MRGPLTAVPSRGNSAVNRPIFGVRWPHACFGRSVVAEAHKVFLGGGGGSNERGGGRRRGLLMSESARGQLDGSRRGEVLLIWQKQCALLRLLGAGGWWRRVVASMVGRSTPGFHRPGRRYVHQGRSAVRCRASRMKGELRPTKKQLLRGMFSHMDDSVNALDFFLV